MGPGHFGIGFAAKTIAPKAPLWVLLTASETLDLLSFGFVALGVEKMAVTQTDLAHGLQIIEPGYVGWSHGLFMAFVWSAAAAAISGMVFRNRRTGMIIGLVVFTHWILDFIVHMPDLPIFFRN
jgi:hypothetical protein